MPAPVSGIVCTMVASSDPSGGMNDTSRPVRPVSGARTSTRRRLTPTRTGSSDTVSSMSDASSTNTSSSSKLTSSVSGSLPGVSASSQPLSAMTTTPITASVPKARRNRSAIGSGEIAGSGQAGLDDLPCGQPDEQHDGDEDGLEQQHPAVRFAEQRPAVEPVQLDRAR